MQPVGEYFLFSDRGIRIRLEIGGQVDRQRELCAEHRLVPAGQQAARIGGFHLRTQQHLLPGGRRIFIVIQPLRSAIDEAPITEAERVHAWLQRLSQSETEQLQILVDHRRQFLFGDSLAGEHGCIDLDVQGIHHQRRGGLQHLDIDGFLAAQGEVGEIRHHMHGVVDRHHILGQFAGGGGK